MGLKDLFSSEGRATMKIARLKKKLMQRFGQPEDRERAAYGLYDIGTDEAMWVLMQRFTWTAEKAIADGDEKQRIHDMLVEYGDDAVPLLHKFIREKETISWGVRTLRSIVEASAVNAFTFELLNGASSEEQDPIKMAEMIKSLRDAKDEPRVCEVLIPMLADFDDDVRFAVIETLESVGDPAAREPLLGRLVNEKEESERVKHRILEALQTNGWEVKGFRKAVEEMLPEGWYLDRSGKIKILEQHQKT